MLKFIKNCLIIFFLGIGSAYSAEILCLTDQNISLLPHGKEVDGMEGDWLIRNDQVVAVIGAAYTDREANQMVSSIQGAVIDYTTRSADNDQLVVYYPQGARVDVPSADTIIVLQSTGPKVQLQVVRYATTAEPYTSTTVYTLHDGEPFLRVTTTYQNATDQPVPVRVYDQLRCDNKLDDVAPKGEAYLAYIDNPWYGATYGVATADQTLSTAGKVGRKNLIKLGYEIAYPGFVKQGQDSATLAPSQKISISRVLLTGADVADIQQKCEAYRGQSDSSLALTLKDTHGQAITEAFVTARDSQGAVLSSSITDSTGHARLYLSPGDHRINVTKAGHDTLRQVVSIPADSVLSLAMEPETKLRIKIEETEGKSIPVKVAFWGIGSTPDPYLGPDTRSQGANNLYYSTASEFNVPLPAGSYQVIVSHGPEYPAEVREVTLKSGASEAITVSMRRLFSTPHWIIADLHNHSTGSGDSNVGRIDRVINLAASGIEFAPATEHNRISSYTDVIQAAGLQDYLASAAGIELSGRPGPGAINHQIAFPLKVMPGQRGYGAPKTDADPLVQMSRLYHYDQDHFKLMQQNHPDIGWLYFDKNQDGTVDEGFGTADITDVMEIREAMADLPAAINGGDTNARSFHWLQMLNQGYRIYGTANSDNHTVGHASGSMFNYVYTEHDQPQSIDPVEIAQQVKKGHVVMSDGPFMEVRVNEALPGDEIEASAGKVQVQIRVQTAPWAPVNTVQLLINGRADSTLFFNQKNHPELFKDGPTVFERSIPVTLKADAHIVVMAYGAGETIGLVTGGKMKDAVPIAISNPVFVDVDGNGFAANHDQLGQPLPTAKKTD